jgi:DNA topoisomerase-1
MDLPKNEIGVELEKRTFEPTLIVSPGKEKVVAQLKKAAAKADEIYLAPDPDREGEAIAYHLALQLGTSAKERKKIRRVTFNEITKKAVQEAFKHPRDLDQDLVDSQQTRRVLDRLVGYQISPLLWDKVRRGLSAGRVQTVAVRLIVEREREIGDFKPVENWTLDAMLHPEKQAEKSFKARFVGIDGEPARVANGQDKDGKEQFIGGALPDKKVDGRGARGAGKGEVVAGLGAVHREAAQAAWLRSSPASCSATRPASWASTCAAPWAWRSGFMRASMWVRRARSASSPT